MSGYASRSLPWPDRFWAKVAVRGPGDCWEWQASRHAHGYGQINMGGHLPKRAHRVAFELVRGPIPVGLTLDHLCRNRACVNPAHLEPVTGAENSRRGVSWWATRSQCANGHPYSEGNFRLVGNARICRPCEAANSRRKRARARVYLKEVAA